MTSWGEGNVGQEASAKAIMPNTTRPDLNSLSGGPIGPVPVLHRLQPAANTPLVVAVGVAEALLKILFFAPDHAVAQDDDER